MNEESEHKDKIDAFLLGQMEEKEEKAFRLQLQDDPVLQKEVALQEKIIHGLKAFNNQELKSRLKAIHREVVKPSAKTVWINPVWRYVGIVASLLLIGIVAFWIFRPEPTKDLFQAYYEPYNFSGSQRGNNERLLAEAVAFYQQGKFQDALPKLDSLTRDQPDSLEYLLAQGICFLEIGQYEQSRRVFLQIIQTGNALYTDQAKWYYALLLIKENQFDEARALLDSLTQNASADHYEDAVRLLNAMNQ